MTQSDSTYDVALYDQHVETLIQFAAKTESTPTLQSYWYNTYAELVKNNVFRLSDSTIEYTIQPDTVFKPITPSATVYIMKHIDKDIHGTLQADINESKFQSTLEVLVRLLDSVLDAIHFATDSQFLVSEFRKVGISIADFDEYIAHKGAGVNISYEIQHVGSLLANGVYRASESLAEEKGVCQGWETIHKIIKDKTFEYWFNIDTGEIKSGVEIAQQFDEESIMQSKYEIVPRRNSHLILCTGTSEWAPWTDREKLLQDTTTIERIVKIEPHTQTDIHASTHTTEVTPDDIHMTQPTHSTAAQAFGMDAVSSQHKQTAYTPHSHTLSDILPRERVSTQQAPQESVSGLDEMLFQSQQIGHIEASHTPDMHDEEQDESRNDTPPADQEQTPSSHDSIMYYPENYPDPEMIDLDDLMKNFDEVEKNSSPLFEPHEMLDSISDSPIKEKQSLLDSINETVMPAEEHKVEEQGMNTTESNVGAKEESLLGSEHVETIDEQNKSDNSQSPHMSPFTFIKNLNPFARTQNSSTSSETYGNEDEPSMQNQTQDSSDSSNINSTDGESPVDNQIQQSEQSSQTLITEDTADESDETLHTQGTQQEHTEYGVGELVKIIDQSHPYFGKYLQVLQIEGGELPYLVLLDGTQDESDTCVALLPQVEPASIEQVLSQLNTVPSHNDIASHISYTHSSSSQDAVRMAILLINTQQQVLVEDKTPYNVLTLPLITDEHDIELAISELLFTNYTITGVRDISQVGFFTNPETNTLTLAYYGVIESYSSIPDGYKMTDISDIYAQSYDVKHIIDHMSLSDKDAIQSLHDREQQIHELQKQLEELTQSMNSTNQTTTTPTYTQPVQPAHPVAPQTTPEQNIQVPVTNFGAQAISQPLTGGIDDEHTQDIQPTAGGISVMSDIEKTAPFTDMESITPHTYSNQNTETQIQHSMSSNSHISPTQARLDTAQEANQSVTYFPQGSATPSTSVWQSTSKVASYSKFSVVLNQVISTAEFGNIVLHVHYDSKGPRVLTVELPQLINDRMLQELRTYLNLINASLIRGSELESVVTLIQDQLELAGEAGPIVTLIGIIINAVNALPKSVQEISTARTLTLDKQTSTDVIKSGSDPLKALVAKYATHA